MGLMSWQSGSTDWRRNQRRRNRPRFRPWVEVLETRLVPTTIHWTNPGAGNWSVATNWDLQRVPGPGDDVVIDQAGQGTVTFDSYSAEVQSLYSTRPFTLGGGTLWVHGQVEVTNTFQDMSYGRLQGATIAADTTLQVTGGSSFLQDVTLQGNVVITNGAALGMAGNWHNRGAITVNSGALSFFASFTLADVGTLHHNGGTIAVAGTLNNTGTTLALDDTTGSWSMTNNGTILGGTVTTQGNARLLAGGFNDRLDGVTFNGNLNVGYGEIRVSHGLTLNGTLTLGQDTQGLSHASFDGTQTLSGQATVVFADSGFDVLEGVSGLLTLAPSVTVQGHQGHLANVVNQGALELSVAQANFTLEGSWTNQGRIDLSAGTLNLDGTFAFSALGDLRRSGGTVNLTGTLGNSNHTLTLDSTTGSWNLLGGTITGGTVTARNGAALLPTSQGGTLNGSSLATDETVPAGTRLSFAGAWANRATLTLSGGTLDLGGTVTLAGLGDFRRNGGTVNLTGTLDNTNGNLTFNAATGPWLLAGGTITGGQVTLLDGIQLQTSPFTSTSVLNGVVVNGYLSVVPNSSLHVRGGLTLNGILAIGSGTGSGSVSFDATQTLAGAATVQLGDFTSNSISDSGGTVTFGTNVLVRGGAGQLANFNNQGTIELSASAANLTFGGSAWTNAGVIDLAAGTLNLGSTFTVASLGTFRRSGGIVNLVGMVPNAGQTLSLTAATGSWQLAGGQIIGGTLSTSGGAALIPTNQGGTLNGVSLNTDITVGTNASLRLDGSWANHGTLTMNGGALTLAGSFTTAALGTFVQTSGTVNLIGSVNNTGATLTLANGSWIITGGTITGGMVITLGNTHLWRAISTTGSTA